MRRWILAVMGLMQTGCYAWATPPLEAQVGFGPAWDERSRSVRTVPSYQASIPISGWHPQTPHQGSTWDVKAGYLFQPMPGERLVHGPLFALGMLIPEEKMSPGRAGGVRASGAEGGVRLGPIPVNQGVVFRRYGVHGQVRGLFGDGLGVELATRFSVEWARETHGSREERGLLFQYRGWSGFQGLGLFVEASAGVLGSEPRWGLTAGLSFRTPATLGVGLLDTRKARELDWVRKHNARTQEQ
ncbi:hypothetical protein [Archangium lipolyticum]|uniref:hypothetical protein n=1 Tax=Archangium lipolyticum TaxID=2970465 RepID=UPI00214A23DD|nr:hypothetical protein [Archangium lipolyticum]